MINDDLDRIIEECLHPMNIVGDMTEDEFIDWLSLGTIQEIRDAIQVFNKYEMYEFSAIAFRYIEDRT